MKPIQPTLIVALLFALAGIATAAESNTVTETNIAVATPRAVTRSRGIATPNADAGTNTPAVMNTNTPTVTSAAPATTPVASDAPITGTDLTSFEIISRRNIFNPNRSGRRVRTTRSERSSQVDSFTLVGTMSYEKGDFAIFDGTSSPYRKTLKLSDAIAGYKVAQIGTDFVKLSAASNQFINLPIGNQMRRVDGGRWTLAGHAEPSSTPVASSSSSSNSSSGKTSRGEAPGPNPGEIDPSTRSSGRPPVPSSSEVQSEIMKRLMQKRESE